MTNERIRAVVAERMGGWAAKLVRQGATPQLLFAARMTPGSAATPIVLVPEDVEDALLVEMLEGLAAHVRARIAGRG